jgi:hypothetical protein
MSALREALADYPGVRRRLGFEMPQDGRLLEGFVELLELAGAQRITTELALAWARMPADAHPHYWRQRLSVARGFARHLATIDPASEVPSKDLLPEHRRCSRSERAKPTAVRAVAGGAHDADHFLDGRRIGGTAEAFVSWRSAGVEPRQVAGRGLTAGAPGCPHAGRPVP